MAQEPSGAAYKVQSSAQDGRVRALILTGFGINCEEEFAAAYRLAGAEATVVHLNEVLHGRVSIHDFDILNFPGGFSFGDDLGSGVVLANKLRYRQTPNGRTLLDDIKQFIAAGKFVLGICNGFQVLVKLGLLPNLGGNVTPEVTLTHNASGRYEDRWVKLRVNPASNTPFLKGIETLEVPVRHGEGRLVVPDAATRAAIEAAALNCLTYVDASGLDTAEYPFNPNGADLNCAGLTDPTGQVFGLMPHPEAFLSAYNHPDWARRRRAGWLGEEGEGLAIFRNIVEHIGQRVASPPSPLSIGEGELVSSSSSNQNASGEINKDSSFKKLAIKKLEISPPSPTERGLGGEATPGATLAEEPAGAYHSAGTLKAGQDARLTADRHSWQNKLKPFGRQMRQQPTTAEDTLWQNLRNRQVANVKFRRQHSIGQFIVDFFSPDQQLIIEVDGAIHTDTEQAAYDAGRTHDLENLGYRLVRFSNEEVLNQLPQVVGKIEALLKN